MTSQTTQWDEATQTSGIEINVPALAAVCAALESDNAKAGEAALADLHPADAADVIEQLSGDQVRSLARLSPGLFSGEILSELSDDVREDVVDVLDARQVATAIGGLESDDAFQVVEELDDKFRAEVLDEVDPKDREALVTSLSFGEDSIGRLMQRELVALPLFYSVAQAIQSIRDAKEDDIPETFYEIYVVDPGFHPVGRVGLLALLRAARDTKLEQVMAPLQTTVTQDMDKEDAAYLFEKYDLPSAPVTDGTGRLVGMVTMDDMVEVMHEEHTEDLLALAGVTEAGLGDTVWDVVVSRAPWLVVNLATAILASMVIAMFEDVMKQAIALAVLMPIVASMGGNAATQGLTVAVRALAVREITKANARRIIVREVLAGLAHGLIFAMIMGLIVWVWFHSLTLAVVIAVAMVVNHFVAGAAGILVPLGLKRLGADPAVASSVFVTTVTDIIGFFVFLGLAALVLVR
ncbi:MAG: magnesium transporter [Robiginitomaculum sp.]|nr:MAG: magnesium transporter [Robiginitomaculum sp.]